MSDTLNDLISSIVMTEDELSIENKHGWHTQSPPLICFQNCFSKSFAADPHNWKQVYPEYYWANQRHKSLETKIKRHQYKSESELADLNHQLYKCNKHLSTIPNPRRIYFARKSDAACANCSARNASHESAEFQTHLPINFNTLSATPAPAEIPCATSG